MSSRNAATGQENVAHTATPVGAAPTHVAASLSNSLEFGYRWNPDLPGIAESAEDAAWLQAHGYPGPEVERYLMSLSTEGLKTLADDGNQSALAVYAYRLAQSGAPQAQTQEALLRSAAAGSAYALKMAGDIYQTVDGYRDPVMASAFYGLLARVGDQGGYGQAYLLGSRLSENQRFQAGLLEESLWRSLIVRNAALATAATSLPRPGYQEFLDKGLRPSDGR